MPRSLLLPVLAVVLSACGGSGDARQQPIPTRDPRAARLDQTFTSARYGYTLRYLAGWSALAAARPLTSDELLSYTSDSADKFSEDPRGTGRPELTIGAHAVPASTTIDDLRRATVRRIADRVGCRPQTQTTTTVDDEQAILLDYPSCATFDTLWTVVVHDSFAFHVVWWSEQGKGATDRPLYEQFLGTLTFKGRG